MWYHTGQCDIPGYFDLPQNGYIGPPQCADSENVGTSIGWYFRNLRVTSLVTFWNGVGGVFWFAPNLVCRASSMRWFRKCTSMGWYFSSLTSYKPCNFCKGVGGVIRFAPNLVRRASSMRWFRKCTSMGWYFSSLTSYKPCNFCKGVGGVFRFAKIWYVGPPRCADSENVTL